MDIAQSASEVEIPMLKMSDFALFGVLGALAMATPWQQAKASPKDPDGETQLRDRFLNATLPTETDLRVGQPWACFYYDNGLRLLSSAKFVRIGKHALELQVGDHKVVIKSIHGQLGSITNEKERDESYQQGYFFRMSQGRLITARTSNIKAWVENDKTNSLSTVVPGHIVSLNEVCVPADRLADLLGIR